MRKKDKKEGDDMPAIIKEMVRVQHTESDVLVRAQQKRLSQLKEMQQRKKDGHKIQKWRIVKELQDAGILDEEGNLSKHYS